MSLSIIQAGLVLFAVMEIGSAGGDYFNSLSDFRGTLEFNSALNFPIHREPQKRRPVLLFTYLWQCRERKW
ncbi:hypothetical protein DAPPUDRAFT_309663 [Daphnia pulex]|uniref:Uncharacterized protein n=1 Tax=Daphnia pulex TaxID=6669 RepID=E9FS59_DAPPU|nr:hypothetical protein DAPPUDRAFT_309663 [Daphnia pulex]|eukprot:EFX89975.1 hypothetical protein DAPPUDRAFT_309663 [Daphnia pulex]